MKHYFSKTKSHKVFLQFILLISFIIITFSATSGGTDIWSPIGLFGGGINDIVIDSNNPNIIYALASRNVYKTIDGGNNWTQKTFDSNGESIGISSQDSNLNYLATSSGLHKSLDAGENWELITVGDQFFNMLCGYAVAISPIDDDIVLAVSSENYETPCLPGFEAPHGIYRSTDAGNTWQLVNKTTHIVGEIHFAPSAPHIVYAAGLVGILKSVDSGETWETINSGFVSPPYVLSLAIDPHNAQVIYIGASGAGIYKSINGGASWTPVTGGLGSTDIRSIIIHSLNQQVIYAGGGNNNGSGIPGVYRSFDNEGASWSPMKTGMDNRAILSMAIDSNTPPNLYAGTISSGIWKYTVASNVQEYGISINDGDPYASQTQVTLSLTAPPGTTSMIISNDGGFGGASWEPFTSQKTWSITSIGTYAIPRIVYAKFKTNGQTSSLYQDDIVLDTTPPTGSISISNTVSSQVNVNLQNQPSPLDFTNTLTNTEYLPIVGKNFRPGFELIGLVLSATDDLSGVNEMQISNDANFTDAEWIEFSENIDWWIPDQGTTIIRAKFRDRAGNESIIYSTSNTS